MARRGAPLRFGNTCRADRLIFAEVPSVRPPSCVSPMHKEDATSTTPSLFTSATVDAQM